MDGAGLGIIIVIALLAGAVLLWAALKPRKKDATVRPVSYRCVGVQPADPVNACDAVRDMAARRFLPGQAPKLPLTGCTAVRCSCRYIHFDDRRAGDRRQGAGAQMRKLQSVDWEERRRSRGRRKTDRRGMLDEAQMQVAIAEKRNRRGR